MLWIPDKCSAFSGMKGKGGVFSGMTGEAKYKKKLGRRICQVFGFNVINDN